MKERNLKRNREMKRSKSKEKLQVVACTRVVDDSER